MRAILTILAKDLRLRLRDRSAFVMGLGAPLILGFILSSIIGDFGADDFSATFAVVDHDGGEAGTGLRDALDGMGDAIKVEDGLGEAEARKRVDDGDVHAAFILPEGLSASLVSDKPKSLDILANADEGVSAQIARSVADGFASYLNAARLSLRTAAVDPASDPGAVEAAFSQASPVQVAAVPDADERQLDAKTYLMAGLGAMFLFFLVQYGVSGLLEERRDGTMARLLAAPVPVLAIPLAKAMTSVVMGLVGLTTLAVVSSLALGANWGDPLAVAVLIVAMVLAAVSIVGVVAGVAKTAEQANNAQSIVAVVLGLLGGSFFPVSQGEGFLTKLTLLTPHHWFLRGLAEGKVGGLGDALPAVFALLAFAVVIGSIGTVVLRRGVWRTA